MIYTDGIGTIANVREDSGTKVRPRHDMHDCPPRGVSTTISPVLSFEDHEARHGRSPWDYVPVVGTFNGSPYDR